MASRSSSLFLLFLLFLLLLQSFADAAFDIHEATILDVHTAFNDGSLTSEQLVIHYLEQIKMFNSHLHAVIEINPDALYHAIRADQERKKASFLHPLHGIPILLKDNIATRDRLNTTAGSFALLGSVVPRDAGLVERLRLAGAIILGKSSMSEWANFRSIKAPSGWSARGGQGRNPYAEEEGPCGSSSGSAIAVAANMVMVSLGTETDGSILCPAAKNSVVGIKPSVGLTSRAGVIPISPRQDTIGPMGRTVADAVAVLDAIVGFDRRDPEATSAAARFIPTGGFRRFLNLDGLKGKRVGILRRNIFKFAERSVKATAFAAHFETMRLLVKDPFCFEEATISDIQAAFKNGSLNSFQLVQHYLDRIRALNPHLNAVLEVNPDAVDDAAKADLQRSTDSHLSPLHGIPILIKDNINTRDKLNTTSGSFALLGSIVPRDAGVIQRLRKAGAIILGKATMSEWDSFRSLEPKQGWSARGGQGRNPYPTTEGPCGARSGSAIAVAANLVTVSLGTDLDGAITCPATMNSIVGIKPTVGLTSRSGMVPISPRLQTIGPMARTVADAVERSWDSIR